MQVMNLHTRNLHPISLTDHAIAWRVTLPPATESEKLRLDQGVEWYTFEGKFDHLLNRKPWHDILDEEHAQGILLITGSKSCSTDQPLIDRLMLAAVLDVSARYHQTPRPALRTETELKKDRLCALVLERDAEVTRLRDQFAGKVEQTVRSKIFDMAAVYQDASVGELNSWIQYAENAINNLKLKPTLPECEVVKQGTRHGKARRTEEKKRKRSRSEDEMDVDEEPEQKKHKVGWLRIIQAL
ncbi:hypothetical protein SAICODRAFT_31888 [Saitoella complicata NRRL Y-17804]|nr:uncharacterized protein SAICODRAFT_31888 [Saitoella complicata NRRL Y-17804]ODQ50618.1 hypothetical protein SAICODRAFT_31888 [Saitoella complicata NRRL Y-17804]